jgi:hypothetical protein
VADVRAGSTDRMIYPTHVGVCRKVAGSSPDEVDFFQLT